MPTSNMLSDDMDAYIEFTSATLGLKIPPDYLLGVKKYLQISLQMMDLLERIEMPIEEDFAPIFLA